MKALIYVTLRSGVLDPQGKAIHHACESLGFKGINDVRQGKFFEIELSDEISAESAKQMLEKLAADVLANPVIEDFRLEIAQ